MHLRVGMHHEERRISRSNAFFLFQGYAQDLQLHGRSLVGASRTHLMQLRQGLQCQHEVELQCLHEAEL